MDCLNPLSVLVHAISNAKAALTVALAVPMMVAMCALNFTLPVVQDAAMQGVSQGVLSGCTVDPVVWYDVRPDMLQRPNNEQYWGIASARFENRSNDPQLSNVFYDNFQNGFNFDKWVVIRKKFGKNNNGIVPLNVDINEDYLILRANGDLYKGPVHGVVKNGGTYPYVDQRTRVGGGVFTKQYFGSGKFEVRAKVMPYFGAYSAFWTFFYEEDITSGTVVRNDEIDIELPGRPTATGNASFGYILGNTFRTEGDLQTNFIDQQKVTGKVLNDGLFHTYRFDWFSGDKVTKPYVKFYIDNQQVGVNEQHVPTIKGRFWIAVWFTDVAGAARFETGEMLVDWVKITPNPAANDETRPETYPLDGFATEEDVAHLRP